MRTTRTAVLITVLTLLGACDGAQKQRDAEAQAAAMAPTNSACPVTGQPADPALVSTHRGQRVAFASAAAQQSWNEMTLDQRDVALARVSRR